MAQPNLPDQSHERRWQSLYLAVLLGTAALFLFTQTLYLTDTDTWTLLAGGRHLFATGEIASGLEHSFLASGTPFTNYSWLFEAVLYGTWKMAGYHGVIFLRALLVLTTCWFATQLVLADRPVREANLAQLLLCGIVVCALCSRGIAVRPMYVSFLAMTLLMFSLQYRPQWHWGLPLLALLWVNSHGIEWVIGAAICGSWVLQQLLQAGAGWRSVQMSRRLAPVLLCLPVLLVNPSGWQVLLTPLQVPAEGARFIAELQPFSWRALLNLGEPSIFQGGALAALMLLAGLPRLRQPPGDLVYPLLVAVVGALLLLGGRRFFWEWLLLSLPLLSIAARQLPEPGTMLRVVVLVVPLVALQWQAYRQNARWFGEYPLAVTSLPQATTAVIQQLGLTGRYAVAPTFGGYISFQLGERVAIHSDMRTPPHSDADYVELLSSHLERNSLDRFVARHAPAMIGVRRDSPFPGHRDFAPIVFDDHLVLYISLTAFPQIAHRYGFRVLNPLVPGDPGDQPRAAVIAELERMLALAPQSHAGRLLLADFLLQSGAVARAADVYAALPQSYLQRNPALRVTGLLALAEDRPAAAVQAFSTLLDRQPDNRAIRLLLAEAALLDRQPLIARRAYRLALNPFRDPDFVWQDYYRWATSEVASGDAAAAARVLDYIAQRAPVAINEPEVMALQEALKVPERVP